MQFELGPARRSQPCSWFKDPVAAPGEARRGGIEMTVHDRFVSIELPLIFPTWNIRSRPAMRTAWPLARIAHTAFRVTVDQASLGPGFESPGERGSRFTTLAEILIRARARDETSDSRRSASSSK